MSSFGKVFKINPYKETSLALGVSPSSPDTAEQGRKLGAPNFSRRPCVWEDLNSFGDLACWRDK